ncbi:hypothetical protein HYW74_01645 [Candidatus Pacearchaeota archaeon]|nr:hypothetical protein [Candidatus Pacearchaeota archaeon]
MQKSVVTGISILAFLSFILLIILFSSFETRINLSPTEETVFYYDGNYTKSYLDSVCFRRELFTVDNPPNYVSPGPYPYKFNINESAEYFLDISHSLWPSSNTSIPNALHLYLDGRNIFSINATLANLSDPAFSYCGNPLRVNLSRLELGLHTFEPVVENGQYFLDYFKIIKISEPMIVNETCAPEGEMTDYTIQCCSGLVRVYDSFENVAGDCVESNAFFCVNEGDGVCSDVENYSCNGQLTRVDCAYNITNPVNYTNVTVNDTRISCNVDSDCGVPFCSQTTQETWYVNQKRCLSGFCQEGSIGIEACSGNCSNGACVNTSVDIVLNNTNATDTNNYNITANDSTLLNNTGTNNQTTNNTTTNTVTTTTSGGASGSGGSGGGGGGGGTSGGLVSVGGVRVSPGEINWKDVASLSQSQLSSSSGGSSSSLSGGERIKLEIEGEYHNVGVLEITNQTVKIIISSDPQEIILVLGETRKIDVDGDGKYEIEVTLKEVVNGKANISIVNINETVTEEIERLGKAQEENAEQTHNKLPFISIAKIKSKFMNRLGVIMWIILIVLAIILIIYFYRRKNMAKIKPFSKLNKK